MNDSDTIVKTTIQRLIQFSRNYSFRREEEIRGYFLADISRTMEERHVKYELIPEHPTAERYSRPDGLRLEPKGKKSGRIDIVLKMPDSGGIGIELEYPRGSGLRNKDEFYSHMRNDLLKLNQEKELTDRYLVIFLYNEPPFDISNLIGELEQEFQGVKFALLVMKKKSSEDRLQSPIQKDMQHPQNWLSLVP